MTKGGIMKLEMIRYIVTGIICLASVGMNSCSRQQAEEKEIIRPVFTMEVSEPSVRQRTFSGTAKSSIATPLAFRVGGKILEIPPKRAACQGRRFDCQAELAGLRFTGSAEPGPAGPGRGPIEAVQGGI